MKSALSFALVLVSFGLSVANAQVSDEPRPFAPGVLKVLPLDLRPEDSFSPPLRIPGLTTESYQGNFLANADSLHGQTQQIVFFRDVWVYEFSTLGLRQIELQMRMPDGTSARKNFFYMVYRLRNLGKSLTYKQVKEGLVNPFIKYELVKTGVAKEGEEPEEVAPVGPKRFLPQFTLEGLVVDDEGVYSRVQYRDEFMPEVSKAIQKFEDPNRRLLNQQEIEQAEFPVVSSDDAPGVWGVAVWSEVDPRLDYVSVFVRGITNAYTIEFDAEGNQTLRHKTLQLNYWRPGDVVEQTRDKIIYGIPFDSNVLSQIQICKHYQLPGPRFNVYITNKEIDGEAYIGGINGEVDSESFDSLAAPQLDKGEFPEPLSNYLAGYGFDVTAASGFKTLIPGEKWAFNLDFQGEPRVFEIRLEPEFWQKDGKGIRFLKRLEYLWVYR